MPTLRHKYNAQVPLGYNLTKNDSEEASSSCVSKLASSDHAFMTQRSLHPYRYEIKHLSYPARMFTASPSTAPRSFENTPFTWVSTPEDLATMLDKLRGASEIAIDLEYHNYRTFGGFVCLMQISTREEDFVVDTLILREELEELNEVFTNPNIVKVDEHFFAVEIAYMLILEIGSAWRGERYRLAATRLQPVHCQSVRYLPRVQSSW